MNRSDIEDIVEKHYAECAGGLVEKPPSQLRRGEGTKSTFYIFKIDVAGSTRLLANRHHATYLKFTHTFLSSVDEITQKFGADERQVEYAGDGLQAYFPTRYTEPNDLLIVAGYARHIASHMRGLDATLASMQIQVKIVIHKGDLIVSRIGPRGAGLTSAIGHPLHRVGHLEKQINGGQGLATKDFASDLEAKIRNLYLAPVYSEKQVEIPSAPSIPSSLRRLMDVGFGAVPQSDPLRGLLNLGLGAQPVQPDLRSLAAFNPVPPPPQYHTEKTLEHWVIRWPQLMRDLSLVD